jgi:hypothetical protein
MGVSFENNKLQLVYELHESGFPRFFMKKGRPMRSLAELANDYERWAVENDAIVTGIMNNVDAFSTRSW